MMFLQTLLRGKEAERILQARQLWDQKATSALWAWTARGNPVTVPDSLPSKEDAHPKRYPATKVGFWYSKYEPKLPVPKEQPTPWPQQALFCDLLKRVQDTKAEVSSYRGFSSCRCCNRPNGSQEYKHGGFIWPEGLLHYVEDHNVILPEDFVTFIINTGKKKS